MRSYRDSLIEYLEAQGYVELEACWYTYLQRLIASDVKPFQILESIPPVAQEIDFNYFANLIPADHLIGKYELFSSEKISVAYKELIDKVVEGEYKRAKDKLDVERLNWDLCKKVLNYSSLDSEISFTDTLRKCLKSADITERMLEDYFQNTQHKLNYLEVIEDFFDEEQYHLNLPNYKQTALSNEKKDIDILFDSRLESRDVEGLWTEKMNHPASDFFHSNTDLLNDLNAKAKLSGISILGKLEGFHKIGIEASTWLNETLMNQLFTEDQSTKELLGHDKSELQARLAKRIETFYCIDGFDLIIEVHNQFTEDEIDLLRTLSFTIFPFHFSSKVNQFKWIYLDDDGKLIIRIKSEGKQIIPIAADLKIYKK